MPVTPAVMKDVSTEYMKSAAKEGGKETVEYFTENQRGEQTVDDAKAQAEVGI